MKNLSNRLDNFVAEKTQKTGVDLVNFQFGFKAAIINAVIAVLWLISILKYNLGFLFNEMDRVAVQVGLIELKSYWPAILVPVIFTVVLFSLENL